MAHFEGWYPAGQEGYPDGSLTYRHHNPCALRSSPFQVRLKDGFAVFASDMDGYAAAKWDISQKARGKTVTRLNGQSTLKDLIEVWAPKAAGNETEAYIESILTMTGFPATMKLADLI